MYGRLSGIATRITMGVPSFYRWLVGKYPTVVVNAIEEDVVDYSNPNPIGVEYDNFYLDMNGIIHPCFHPEDQISICVKNSAPSTYDEVFVAVFEYVDRIIRIVRPRKLVYMAIDGVAPRAKMNQQRSRRFRTAKDATVAEEEELKLRKEFEREQKELLPYEKNELSDSNVITPGTIFMEKLSKALEYYIRLRLNSDPGWKDLKVILSDANVPGEGEHKIMNFIRAQRNSIGYDVNTTHCLYGLDADLIFLALATHEIHFSILREDVFTQDQQENCQTFRDASITAKEQASLKSKKLLPTKKKPYQFLNIWTLREYLELDFMIHDPPLAIDVERVIDDFIFICLLAGNDFLPHIPSLGVHQGAIDLLIDVYKRMFKKIGGYLIDSSKIKDKKAAYIKVSRVERYMAEVGSFEERIFTKRHGMQQNLLRRLMRERLVEEQASANNFDNWEDNPGSIMSESFKAKCVISSTGSEMSPENVDRSDALKNTEELRIKLKDILRSKQDLLKDEVFHNDRVKLGSPGWKYRYYCEKFSVEGSNEIESLRKRMVEKYMEGLCWVLHYYFSGLCSWSWYYPFHYAPFASDFKCLSCSSIVFKLGSPLKPFDQLMAVLPPRSSACLPKAYMPLMSNRESTILKFYPTDFELDTDGQRYLWQGIIKLPFIEEELLVAATKVLEGNLSVDEANRNVFRHDKIFTRSCTSLGLTISSSFTQLNYPSEIDDQKVPIDSASCKISGFLCLCDDKDHRRMEIKDNITEDHTMLAIFLNPDSSSYIPKLLENVIKPEKTVTVDDIVERPLWHEYQRPWTPLMKRSQGRGQGVTGSSSHWQDNAITFGRGHGYSARNNSSLDRGKREMVSLFRMANGPSSDPSMGFASGRGRGRAK